MRFEVYVTADAERDIEDLYAYLVDHRSIEDAEYVKEKLLEVTDRLEGFPNRGAIPPDLRDMGWTEFREVFFKPYRVIYRIVGTKVYIYVVADGRRNLASLLARRLL